VAPDRYQFQNGLLFEIACAALTVSAKISPGRRRVVKNSSANRAWQKKEQTFRLELHLPTASLRWRFAMAEVPSSNKDFGRAFGEARKNAAGVASDAVDAAQEVYDQSADSASQVIDSASKAAWRTAGSFEQALKNTVETQPYAATAIALGIGWLLGRMHRPI
jgi:hypothetical protein